MKGDGYPVELELTQVVGYVTVADTTSEKIFKKRSDETEIAVKSLFIETTMTTYPLLDVGINPFGEKVYIFRIRVPDELFPAVCTELETAGWVPHVSYAEQ